MKDVKEMSFEEYRNTCIEEMTAALRPDEELDVCTISKLNRGELEGIRLKKIGSEYGATLYFNDLYKDKVEPWIVMEWLRSANADVKEYIKNPTIDEIAEKAYFRMCNKERNKGMLKNSITLYYPELGDVVLYAVYPAVETKTQTGTIRLTTNQMQDLGVTESIMVELKERMIQNTAKLVEVRPLKEVLEELSGVMYVEESPFIVAKSEKTMASAFVKPIMKQFKKNVFVIPSSTMELLFIYEDETMGRSTEELKQLIKDVNENVVEDDIFLSNNLYLYNAETEKITTV
ncbi:MAG: hypothetical protein IJM25_11725 [Eubacterium sp.]|nr:hypothetical protein [Eubacterium sp.]